MNKNFPTYTLAALSDTPAGEAPGIFCTSQQPVPGAAPGGRPRPRIDIPYRSSYYKIGLCLGGYGRLQVNLDPYEVTAGCLVLTPPHVIKQWPEVRVDYASVDVFFTRAFAATSGLDPDRFAYFQFGARAVIALTDAQVPTLTAALRALQAKYAAPGAYRAELLNHLLNVLLYEIAAAYEVDPTTTRATLTRRDVLATHFKQLVQTHYAAERGLDFYAARLGVTAKHLTETVKGATGRTAGSWLTEALTLEARVLLHDPAVSVGEVADRLRFADQSAFGRFFKGSTGLSPTAYRRGL